ncbi:MAG: hypothetical protein QM528_03660 [Phycisphaerales bacterium]|nr:hypothetical protein [Phycisphaerales bacterium]
MKFFFVICIMLGVGLLQTHVFAQNTDEQKSETAVLATYRTIRRLIITKNYDSLKYFMDKNVYVHRREGTVLHNYHNFTEYLALFKSKKFEPFIKIIEVGTPYIFVHDHVGVVIGKFVSTRKQSDGREVTYPINYTSIFRNEGNGWVQFAHIQQDAAN